MPSVLNVDTLVAANGTDPVTLTKQSASKQWSHINASFVVQGSFNTSSCVDEGGNAPNTWTINFTNSMSDNNYVICGVAETSGTSPRTLGAASIVTGSYFMSSIVSNSPTSGTGVVGSTSVNGDLA